MRHKFLLASVLLLTACGSHGKVYTVDGSSAKFCVPKKNVIPDISWVPPDKPGTPKGFSFQGCWNADPSLKADCTIPFLRGADVGPLSKFKGDRWQDIYPDALYRTMVTSPGAKLEAVDNGSIVVVSNPLVFWQWLVWRKAVPVPVGTIPTVTDGDSLVAACENETTNIPYKRGSRKFVECTRTFAAKDVAITYKFEASDRLAHGVNQMDASVVAQLDNWRCQ